MARAVAVAAAIAVALLAVSGATGATEQTPKRGGTVVVGLFGEPTCLNPLLQSCSDLTSGIEIRRKVLLPPLLERPNSTYQPALGSRVAFTRKRPFTLTYHIRPEARWSDGVPVTARDFAFTLRMIRRHGWPVLQEEHAFVRRLRVVDRKTFQIVLRPRHAGWRSLFGNVGTVLPEHALRGTDVTRVWLNGIVHPKTGRPIGSGPFLVERYERGRQLTLVRNRKYWGRPAHLDRIVIRFCRAACDDEEALLALRGGNVDVASFRDVSLLAQLRGTTGITLQSVVTTNWNHLAFNLGPRGHPALKSKLVRHALAYGVDREAIARDLFGVLDRGYEPSHSAVFLSPSRFYRPNWREYRYDPPRARRLLEQAGCRRAADGIYDCAGERLSLLLRTTVGSPHRVPGAQLMREQLRRIGVEVRVSFDTGRVLFDELLPRGEYDVAFFSFIRSDDLVGLNGIYGCQGSVNRTGYCQRIVTRDLDQADRILDAGRRARVLDRVDRQLAKDVPVLPLYQLPEVLASRRSIRNVRTHPLYVLWNAEDWWLER